MYGAIQRYFFSDAEISGVTQRYIFPFEVVVLVGVLLMDIMGFGVHPRLRDSQTLAYAPIVLSKWSFSIFSVDLQLPPSRRSGYRVQIVSPGRRPQTMLKSRSVERRMLENAQRNNTTEIGKIEHYIHNFGSELSQIRILRFRLEPNFDRFIPLSCWTGTSTSQKGSRTTRS